MNKFSITFVLVASIIASLCTQLEAQKTIKKSFQQSIASSNSNPGSVYGGYTSNSQRDIQSTSNLVAPVQKQRYSSSSSSVQSVALPARPIVSSNNYQQSSYEEQSSEQQAAEADAEPASYGSVNGQPGKDFPAYTRVPKTSFSCDGLPYDYGMYADEETGCQAYHVCYNGRKDSFLCGVGTVFNQRILHCDYWYSVDCGKSSQYYSSNAYMGSSQPEPGPAQASGSSTSYNKVSKTQITQSQIAAGSQPVRINQQASSNQWSRNTVQQQRDESY